MSLSFSNAVLLDVEIVYETVPVKHQNGSKLNTLSRLVTVVLVCPL